MKDIDWTIPDPSEDDFPIMTKEEPLQDVSALMPVFDTEKAITTIETKYNAEVDKLVRMAGGVKITDAESAKVATDLGAYASLMIKQINALVDKLTEGSKAHTKKTKAKGETFTTRLRMVYDAIIKKLTEYNSRLELERRKQEELAKKATEEFQATLNAEAEEAGVEAPIVAAPVIPEQKTNIKTESGATAFTGGRWKATVNDENLVPREYCSPDSKKINAAVRAGVREIPGIVIKKDEKARIRT